jgi:protoporphyrinogen/coproporphyrinogen III oxidase
MTSSHDIVILGGGIAGLTAAWELASRGRRPLVLERASRPGGVIVTERVDGFTIDGGPDALLIQKPAALQLARELGLGERLFPTLTPRTAFVLRGGRLLRLPEASFLGIPTRIGPFVTTRLFS